tara:strand:+ start:39 stop:143 length:105 start_codon:yes stop_codon:yes gene_type:complete
MFYFVIIVFCLNVSGCGVKSSPFLDKKTNVVKDE